MKTTPDNPDAASCPDTSFDIEVKNGFYHVVGCETGFDYTFYCTRRGAEDDIDKRKEWQRG